MALEVALQVRTSPALRDQRVGLVVAQFDCWAADAAPEAGRRIAIAGGVLLFAVAPARAVDRRGGLRVAAGVPATVAAGVPTGVAATVLAGVATGVPATIAAGVTATVPTGVPATIAAGVTATVPTGVPATIATGVPATVATGVTAALARCIAAVALCPCDPAELEGGIFRASEDRSQDHGGRQGRGGGKPREGKSSPRSVRVSSCDHQTSAFPIVGRADRCQQLDNVRRRHLFADGAEYFVRID